MDIVTLKRRSEFLRVRGGARWSTADFVLEARPRASSEAAGCNADEAGDAPRFGFTVTKKLGGAVVRNRIRRRLREAVRSLDAGAALRGHDYVLIARAGASMCPFERLQRDIARALGKVNMGCARALPAAAGQMAKADNAGSHVTRAADAAGSVAKRNRKQPRGARETR